jgi:hypothetical protein
MMRRIFAIAVGLCACGDSNHLVPDAASPGQDAGIDSMPPADAPPDAFVDTTLILRYDFEDSMTATKVADTSGRAKDGMISDMAAWSTAGRTNHGIALNGGRPATQYVSLPSGVLTNVSDFTISVWVKFNLFDVTTDFARIYDLGNGTVDGSGTPATRWMFMTVLNGEGVHVSSFGGSPQNENIVISGTATGTNTLPTGVWKHFALTGTGGTRQLFIDGYPAASVTGGPVVNPSEMEPLAPDSWLGRSRFDSPDHNLHDPGLNGSMDEFRIYNRVLAQTEIADLAWPQHDYSYWRFDETSGQTAKDSSDNAIPSVVMSGPTSAPTWVTGKLGGALDFPGGAHAATGPHVELETAPLGHCTDQLTVATWVKLHSQDPWARVFDFGTDTSSIYLTLFDDQGSGVHGMRFAMFTATDGFNMFTPTPPIAVDDMWHHVAVTVAPSVSQSGAAQETVTMYVDGAAVTNANTNTNTTTVRVSDFTTTTQNYLGKSKFVDTDPYLNAALDELRISCRAFTADEIKGLAHQ